MSDTTDDLERYLLGTADFLRDYNDFEEKYVKDLYEAYKAGTLHWTSQKNEQYLVQNMKNGYLVNVINFLKKSENQSPSVLAWIDIFETEFTKRITDV